VMGRPPYDTGDRIGLEYVGEPSVAFSSPGF